MPRTSAKLAGRKQAKNECLGILQAAQRDAWQKDAEGIVCEQVVAQRLGIIIDVIQKMV